MQIGIGIVHHEATSIRISAISLKIQSIQMVCFQINRNSIEFKFSLFKGIPLSTLSSDLIPKTGNTNQ